MPFHRRHTVTRRFIEGVLKGMTHTASTTASYVVGQTYGDDVPCARYVVTDIH